MSQSSKLFTSTRCDVCGGDVAEKRTFVRKNLRMCSDCAHPRIVRDQTMIFFFRAPETGGGGLRSKVTVRTAEPVPAP